MCPDKRIAPDPIEVYQVQEKIITAKELAEHVNGTVIGDEDARISGAATLSEATSEDISFLANPKYEKELQTTPASIVIVGDEYDESSLPQNTKTKAYIISEDPYFAFMNIIVLLHGHRDHKKVGISAKASISPNAKIGDNVDIHDFVVVSDNVVIGDNTRIYPNCTLSEGACIGSDCIIFSNVSIYDNCTVGNRVTIHSGTVVGQDGFGYATHDGIHYKIPQIGSVIIEDDVEIGANCAIDRGTLGDTIIGQGTKMSNLVAIGHNTRIGANCLLVAQVGIAGSVDVGPYCVFAGQVGVVGHIKIGEGSKIGAQAGVTNDIPEGSTVVGSPAQPITQAKRSIMLLKDLPEFRKKLKEMEKFIRDLKEDAEADNGEEF